MSHKIILREMNWTHETTTTLEIPKMHRKKHAGPPLPEDPAERIDQVRAFMHDLAELYDHEHYDVYDSIFFVRVGDIMKDTHFDEQTYAIRDLGRAILDTRSTSVKQYISFFKSILAYLDTIHQ